MALEHPTSSGTEPYVADDDFEVFRIPRAPETAKDTSEIGPRKAGAGDIVTIEMLGKRLRIYLTDETFALTGPAKDVREELEGKGVNSISAINPQVPPGKERKYGLTLGAQLAGNSVGDVVTLQTGKSVTIIEIELFEV